MRQAFASIVQLVGIGSIAAACYTLSITAGIGATGAGLIIVGLALERDI